MTEYKSQEQAEFEAQHLAEEEGEHLELEGCAAEHQAEMEIMEQMNKEAYEEELWDEQADTARGYRYI